MKKLLLVLAIGAFVACNESSTEETTVTDSSAVTVDTNTTAAPAPDTTAPAVDTSAAKAADSTKK